MNLFAQVLYLQQDEEKVVIITADLLTLGGEFVTRMRETIESGTGIDGDRVMLSASHTHSGPTTKPFRQWGKMDKDYVRELERILLAAVNQAAGSAQPVRISMGTGSVDSISENRRGLADIRDTSVPVIRLDKEDGKPLCILYGFGCHPVSLHSYGNLFSPDYPGYTRSTVRAILGEDVQVMFILGTAGDINPKGYVPRTFTPDDSLRMGAILGCEVAKTALESQPASKTILEISQEFVDLPCVPLPSREELEQLVQKYSGEADGLTEVGESVERVSVVEIRRDWAKDSLQALQDGVFGEYVPCEMTWIRLGDAVIFFAPLELFTGTGLAINLASPARTTLIASNSNGALGYLPTLDAYLTPDYTNPEGLAPKVYGVHSFSEQAEPIFRKHSIQDAQRDIFMSDEIRIVNLEPTVFYRRGQDGSLDQQAILTLDNMGDPIHAVTTSISLITSASQIVDGSRTHHLSYVLNTIPSGREQFPVYLPDIQHPASLFLEIAVGTRMLDRREFTWFPGKHWEIYLVHGSHHDLGYTDIPSNVLSEHDHHLDKVLEFCEQTQDWPDEVKFRYVIEQAWSILHYIDNRSPETTARMVEFIRQGRIEVTAFLDNMTAELCGHEQQVRLVYPAFRLADKYGFQISSAEHNDIPGIPWGFVSVLSGSGVRYFAPSVQDYFAWGFKVHPNWDEDALLMRDMPGAFWWQGRDGSRVLCWFSGDKIENAWLWNLEGGEKELSEFLDHLSTGGYTADMVRVKLLGGRRDNAPPDLRISQVARQWNERWAFPRLRVSTNAEFFSRFEKTYGSTLRTLRGDLPNTDYPIGAISHAKEVAVNRQTHDFLPAAEKFAAWASMVSDYEYPSQTLTEAYTASLFHDGHCGGMAHPIGPAQDAAWSQKHEFAYRANALAHDVFVKSTNRIADQIRFEQEGNHIVVFNSLAQPRSDVVRMMVRSPDPCGMPMYWQESLVGKQAPAELVPGTVIGRKRFHIPVKILENAFELIDTSTGKQVPVQLVYLNDPLAARPYAAQRWALGQVESNNPETIIGDAGHHLELLFEAQDVPSMGFKTYLLNPISAADTSSLPGTDLRIGDCWLENGYYRVELDVESGAVTSIYDKLLRREWVDDSARFGFNQLLVRSPQTGAVSVPDQIEVLTGENGPLCASLLVKARAPGCPQLTLEITLYHGIRRIDFANRVLRDSTPFYEVYFAFPLQVKKPRFHFETSNCVVEPIRDQLPGTNTDAYTVQHWVSVSDAVCTAVWSSRDAPVVALGDLWPGYVSQAHHGITPPGYGHEFLTDPDQLIQGHIYSYVMNNNFRTNFDPVQVADVLFRYSITTREGDWQQIKAPDFGWGCANPLETVCLKGPQPGKLDLTTSFCRLDQENIQLLAIKLAEDGDGLILRLAEVYGLGCHLKVNLPLTNLMQVWRCDLVERNLESLPHDDDSIDVDIQPYALVTIRCRLQRLDLNQS